MAYKGSLYRETLWRESMNISSTFQNKNRRNNIIQDNPSISKNDKKICSSFEAMFGLGAWFEQILRAPLYIWSSNATKLCQKSETKDVRWSTNLNVSIILQKYWKPNLIEQFILFKITYKLEMISKSMCFVI
jgi:hypothetical protein